MAVGHETVDDVRADESRAAGHDCLHRAILRRARYWNHPSWIAMILPEMFRSWTSYVVSAHFRRTVGAVRRTDDDRYVRRIGS